MKATVFGEAMVGLEEWKFPTEFYMIDGDTVVVKWWQVLPGTPRRRQRVRAVGLLDARLRRRRQVLLRGGPAEHGARLRGHQGERFPLLARDGCAAQAARTATSRVPRAIGRVADRGCARSGDARLRRDLPAPGRVRRRGDPARVVRPRGAVPPRCAGHGRHRHERTLRVRGCGRDRRVHRRARSSGSSSSSS